MSIKKKEDRLAVSLTKNISKLFFYDTIQESGWFSWLVIFNWSTTEKLFIIAWENLVTHGARI